MSALPSPGSEPATKLWLQRWGGLIYRLPDSDLCARENSCPCGPTRCEPELSVQRPLLPRQQEPLLLTVYTSSPFPEYTSHYSSPQLSVPTCSQLASAIQAANTAPST